MNAVKLRTAVADPLTVTRSAPLQGIRVVDMTTVMMGPYATLQLAEMGADVIKVEAPDGDSMRSVGPMRSPGMGPLFLHANRGKRSIAVDLKCEDGRDIMTKLVMEADVFVSNIRAAALARLGLDYDSLSRLNPKLIYATSNGFGAGGEYEGRPAYDDLIQGLAGVPELAARASGDGIPRYAPIVMADRVTGLMLANGILAALVGRAATGRGRSLDVPMFEAITHMVMGDHLGGLTFDPPIGPSGYSRLLVANRRPFKTKDGHICAVIYTSAHWKAFLELDDDGDLYRRDPRFCNLQERTKHIGELYAMVAERMLGRTSAEWLLLLTKADIPAAPMHTPESLLDDPHLKAVCFFEHTGGQTEGDIIQMRHPCRMSDMPVRGVTQAPRLGANTKAILREIGYPDDIINRLIAEGCVLEQPLIEAEQPLV
jgi:crotonobetainyl-CoA:carnitine CoA-transferase CaiB-like acyl-CoA transferase